jgi:hypothetical protein
MRVHDGLVGLLVVLMASLSLPVLFPLEDLAQPQSNAGPISARKTPGQFSVGGTVESVLHPPCWSVAMQGGKRRAKASSCGTTDLILGTANGRIYVHLGPTKFIRNQRFYFVEGDRLWIIGRQTDSARSTTETAERVIKDHRELTLRDATGRPLWAVKEQNDSHGVPAIVVTARHKNDASKGSPPQSPRPDAAHSPS